MDDSQRLYGKGPDKNPYTKEAMAWKIFQLLPELIKTQRMNFYKFQGIWRVKQVEWMRMIFSAMQTDSDALRFISDLPSTNDTGLAGKENIRMAQTDGRGFLWRSLRNSFGQDSLPELMKLDPKQNSFRLEFITREIISIWGFYIASHFP